MKRNRKKIIRAVTVSMSCVFFDEIMKRMRGMGYEMVALCSDGPELEKLRGEGFHCIAVEMERHISPWKDLLSLMRLVWVLLRERPLVVHSMTPKAGLLCMMAAWMTRVPVRIHTFTGLVWPTATGLKRQILKLTDRITCACATHVIPEGKGVMEDLRNGSITRKPMRVLGYGNVKGVDMERFDRERFTSNDNCYGASPNVNGRELPVNLTVNSSCLNTDNSDRRDFFCEHELPRIDHELSINNSHGLNTDNTDITDGVSLIEHELSINNSRDNSRVIHDDLRLKEKKSLASPNVNGREMAVNWPVNSYCLNTDSTDDSFGEHECPRIDHELSINNSHGLNTDNTDITDGVSLSDHELSINNSRENSRVIYDDLRLKEKKSLASPNVNGRELVVNWPVNSSCLNTDNSDRRVFWGEHELPRIDHELSINNSRENSREICGNSRSEEKKDFAFLFVGRIVGDKGVNELVEAFVLLNERFPETRLVLVGEQEETLDPLSPETLKRIGETEAIMMRGAKYGDELLKEYAEADCFVMPSYREGFPNTVLEAGAMGLPSIVTDINGSREIIVQQSCGSSGSKPQALNYQICSNGIIVPPRKARQLYDAMERMLTDTEMREKMQQMARPMIATRFEKGFVQKCLIDYYEEVIKAHS